MENLPIACSLDAQSLSTRLAEIADVGGRALLDTRTSDGEAVLRFAAGAGIRPRLEAIVAAEQECCAFMAFQLAQDGDELVLTVRAPADAQLVLEDFAAAFAARDAAA